MDQAATMLSGVALLASGIIDERRPVWSGHLSTTRITGLVLVVWVWNLVVGLVWLVWHTVGS